MIMPDFYDAPMTVGLMLNVCFNRCLTRTVNCMYQYPRHSSIPETR
jgi:hypothetical protein